MKNLTFYISTLAVAVILYGLLYVLCQKNNLPTRYFTWYGLILYCLSVICYSIFARKHRILFLGLGVFFFLMSFSL